MRSRLRWASLVEQLRTNLWVVPVSYSTAAALLAIALVRLDGMLSREGGAWFLYGGQADGARELLSTIASSMLTIAGLVFSITILVLQLASSQFSPRVLRTFLADSITQRAMGMFLGSFVYAMMLLPEVRSETDDAPAFVPSFAVFVAFALVLVSVGMFVQYIHHMAHAIRAVNILARVARETRRSLARMYPSELRSAPTRGDALPDAKPAAVLTNQGEGRVVVGVDESALMRAALRDDLVIAVVPRVGDFVAEGAPLVRIWGRVSEEVSAAEWIALAQERTPDQDPIFGFRQLVDIAERALSPGINDPTTATQALDHLHDLLRYLCSREIPSPVRREQHGEQIRLYLPRPEFADYVRLSFEEIRLYGSASIQVVRRARLALEDLLTLVDGERAAVLREELARLDAAALRSLPGLS